MGGPRMWRGGMTSRADRDCRYSIQQKPHQRGRLPVVVVRLGVWYDVSDGMQGAQGAR